MRVARPVPDSGDGCVGAGAADRHVVQHPLRHGGRWPESMGAAPRPDDGIVEAGGRRRHRPSGGAARSNRRNPRGAARLPDGGRRTQRRRTGGEYAAILYRASRLTVRRTGTFWFSDTPDIVASITWGNAIERICTWALVDDRQGRTFYIYNLHLDHVSQPSREKSVSLLLDRIAARSPSAPLVVTGDFNTGETNPATRAMAAVLRDTFRVIHPDATEVGHVQFVHASGAPTGDKIDYIFVEPATEVLSAEILRTSRTAAIRPIIFPSSPRSDCDSDQRSTCRTRRILFLKEARVAGQSVTSSA